MAIRVVFDLDGTLIDSAPDILAMTNDLIAPYSAQITLAQTHQFLGDGVGIFISRLLVAVGLSEDLHGELLVAFKTAYMEAVHDTPIYSGVIEALAGLKSEGCVLGICTNKLIKPCMAILNHLDLAAYFETFWGGDSLPVHKPDPAPLRAALDALGQGPCVYVGDSEVDAQTAQAAGVPFLLFTEGYRKTPVEEIPHTATFDNFADLAKLVRRYAVSL